LQLDVFVFHSDHPRAELDTDGQIVVVTKTLVGELKQQT
jgi:hypothetical protein